MKIQIPDDFDPEKIIRSGQCFRASAQPDGSFHFITGKNTLSLSPLGTDTWEADCTPYAWKRVWAPYFDLSVSYKSLRRSIPAKDHFLRAAAGYGKGIRILRQDPFEMLITFIIHSRYTEFRGKTLSCRRKENCKKRADFLHISLPVSAREIICQ